MYILFFINSTSAPFLKKKPIYKKLGNIPSKIAKPGRKLKVERETNNSSKSIDSYAYAIKIKHQFFDTWLTVQHIPREISCHCYFFMEEGGNITGNLISTTSQSNLHKVFLVPSGRLEVLLLLTFSVKIERIFKLMKSFLNDLNDCAYTGEQAENSDEESGDDEEIDIKLTG